MARYRDVPVFPLGLVLYPNERLPLHIFEPRYKEMIRHCLETSSVFGIVLFDEGKMEDVGCTARIERVVEEYEDGQMDILVRGQERFRLLEVRQERSYLTADVERIEEPSGQGSPALTQRAITQHMKLLELAGRTFRPNLYSETREISYIIAHNAGLTLRQKQDILEMLREEERIVYLVEHLEMLIPQVEQIEDVRRRIQSNGHFQDF